MKNKTNVPHAVVDGCDTIKVAFPVYTGSDWIGLNI